MEHDLKTGIPELVDALTTVEWRDRLVLALLKSEAANLSRAAWYLAKQPVPDVPAKYRASYRLLLDMSRNAWARLVIDAIAERISLTGVRLAGDDTDLDLWRILTANHIDADQRLAHADALIFGRSYYSVWPTVTGGVRIVPESPMQVIHQADPADGRMTVAAVKLWRDTIQGRYFCNLYTAQTVYRWSAPLPDEHTPRTVSTIFEHLTKSWAVRDEVPNPLGAVPIVPLNNRPTLFSGDSSEIDDIEPVLRRVDKLTLDLILTSDVAAFRQKWATGLKVPRDPETDKPIEPFDAAVSKLWVSEAQGTKFGSFEASPLEPYLKALDAQVAQISAISRVPSYYLVSPNLVNPPSADTMEAVDAGLIHKVEGLMSYWGESYETILRLALRAVDDPRADAASLTMMWADPSMPSKSKIADAAVKWSTVGVPDEALWEMGGASQEDVARWKAIAQRNLLTSMMLTNTETDGTS